MNRQEAIAYVCQLARSVAGEFASTDDERSTMYQKLVNALSALGVNVEELPTDEEEWMTSWID